MVVTGCLAPIAFGCRKETLNRPFYKKQHHLIHLLDRHSIHISRLTGFNSHHLALFLVQGLETGHEIGEAGNLHGKTSA